MKLTPEQEQSLCRLFESDSSRFYIDVTRSGDAIVQLSEELRIKNIVGNGDSFLRATTDWEVEDRRLAREKCIADEIAASEERRKRAQEAYEDSRRNAFTNITP